MLKAVVQNGDVHAEFVFEQLPERHRSAPMPTGAMPARRKICGSSPDCETRQVRAYGQSLVRMR